MSTNKTFLPCTPTEAFSVFKNSMKMGVVINFFLFCNISSFMKNTVSMNNDQLK